MDENNNTGIGIPGVSLIVFIVLKLCNLVDWPWWVVLSPLWLYAIIILVVILFIVAKNIIKK